MKKTLRIASTILTWLLVVAAVSMMIFTIVSVNTFGRKDKSIFGYKAFIVLSDSMSKIKQEDGSLKKGYFNAGDLVLVKKVDTKKLKVGDIISYESTNTENFGEIVTHKIKEIKPEGFVTYGTTTGAVDKNLVEPGLVIGRYEGRIPSIGHFFNFLKTTQGYIICILLPFLVLIIIQGLNSIRLFKKYKSEQLSAIKAEREEEMRVMTAERKKLEEERKKSEEMMAELLKMREEMAKITNKTEDIEDINNKE